MSHLARNLSVCFFVFIVCFVFAIALLFLGCRLGRSFQLSSYFLVLNLRLGHLGMMKGSLDRQDIVIYFYLIVFA